MKPTISARYRRERELRPNVYLGIAADGMSPPVMLELLPWASDAHSNWAALARADECERTPEGMLCVTSLVADRASSSSTTDTELADALQAMPTRPDTLTPPRAVLGGASVNVRDLTESFRAELSAPPREVGVLGKLRLLVAARKRLAAFAVGFGVVLALSFAMLLPRQGNAQASVPAAVHESDAATPVPSLLATPAPSNGTPSPIELASLLSASIADAVGDSAATQLRDSLRTIPGAGMVVQIRSQSGDIMLAAVAAFAQDGTISRASVVMQRDDAGWRLREVQPG